MPTLDIAEAASRPPLTAEPDLAVRGEVILAAALLAIGVLPAVFVLPHDTLSFDSSVLMLAWLPLGVAGVIVIDRRRGSALGWSSVLASTSPLLMIAWAGLDVSSSAEHALGPLWLLPLLGPAVAVLHAHDRAARRWRWWVWVSCVGAIATSSLMWIAATGGPLRGDLLGGVPVSAYGATATAGLFMVAVTVAATVFIEDPRPIEEPLLDVALGLGVVGVGLATGLLLRLFAQSERVFAADFVGATAGAMAAVLAVPVAIGLRRNLLERRYGPGVLSPEVIATMTADLHAVGDSRQLLDKAARMVTAASGITEASIVLDEAPDAEGWTDHQLVIGDHPVGTLSVRGRSPEGLEARQTRAVAQLLPTVALVARAVSLAVETEHARQDLAYQREAERARILADLHDDLGPMLAGMSMRVAAARELDQVPALADLAEDLAACRADLRRIVSGLTPKALESADTVAAIEQLVASFDTTAGLRVHMMGGVPHGIDGPIAVLLYRAIAEAITNAVRHAYASEVTVELTRIGDQLELLIADDGKAGVIVPGIGLSSLRARVEEVSGTLVIDQRPPHGTKVLICVPDGAR